MPSIVIKNVMAWPARKSDDPEQVNPISCCVRPTASLASFMSGTMNSTSDSVLIMASCR